MLCVPPDELEGILYVIFALPSVRLTVPSDTPSNTNVTFPVSCALYESVTCADSVTVLPGSPVTFYTVT